MSEVFQPWTDGYLVAFVEHDPTFSNIPKFGVARFFEDPDVWVHEFVEMTIHEWMLRETHYISHRASHILTSLTCFSAIRLNKKLVKVNSDEYRKRIVLGRQKKLTHWWIPVSKDGGKEEAKQE